MRLLRQRGAWGFLDGDAVFPGLRRDGNVARESASSTERFGEADGDQRAFLWYLVEIGHTLGLRVVILQDPRLAGEIGRGVGIQWLVAVKENLPLQMKELDRIQLHARVWA